MHRLVTNCPDNLIPDHIHGEKSTTDNRKSNLRIVNRSQNSMNVKIRSDNASGITGISWDKRSNKWCVRIMVKGKNIYLGYFNKDDLDKAIQARLDGEKKYFGEYSYTHSQKIPIDQDFYMSFGGDYKQKKQKKQRNYRKNYTNHYINKDFLCVLK